MEASQKPKFPLETLPFHEKPTSGVKRLHLMVSTVLERLTAPDDRDSGRARRG